jgi:hypothetical protein
MVILVTALISLGSVIVGALVSGLVAWLVLGKRIEADEKLVEKRFEFDKELARQKFEFERAQVIHKRRFELAESLLAEAYRLRDLIAFVRNSAVFGDEGESRKSEEFEPERLKRDRDVYFVPIERLQKESEFISGLMARQYAARAHFGPDASKAFLLFGRSIFSVRFAANALIRYAGQGDLGPQDKEQFLKEIWAPLAAREPGKDEIGNQVEEAVALIEGFCRPALEWRGA